MMADGGSLPDWVLAVMVFGSRSRGDADLNSDSDTLVLCLDATPANKDVLRESIARALSVRSSDLTIYRETEFEHLMERGSLFAWHLKLEGRLVRSRIDVAAVFEHLRPYDRHLDDLLQYDRMLDDIGRSLAVHGTNRFDLAALFTVSRNSLMVICHKLGKPTFGRLSVFYRARELLGGELEVREDTYLHLAAWKLAYNRGITSREEMPDESLSRQYFAEVRRNNQVGKEICCGNQPR